MTKELMTLAEALDGIKAVRDNTAQTLYGIDEEIKYAALGMFTRVAYTREEEGILYKDFAPAPVIITARHGVGKTDLARNMAFSIGGKFSFISGQPEMSASKIIGHDVYVRGEFFFAEGDINTHVLLFDELTRTPPKILATFFQSMEERQAIVETFDMNSMKVINKRTPLTPISDNPNDSRLFFWPIATGNPFEQEGTYEAPEALWDRFSIHFGINYPDREKEKLIDSRNAIQANRRIIKSVISLEQAYEIGRFIAENVHIGSDVEEYIQRLTENSRPTEKNKKDKRQFAPRKLKQDIDMYVKVGTSPRYKYHFTATVRTLAAFYERLYVTIDDVREAYYLVATHRILLNHIARGRNITQREIAGLILEKTPTPSSGARSAIIVSSKPWNLLRFLKKAS